MEGVNKVAEGRVAVVDEAVLESLDVRCSSTDSDEALPFLSH